MLEVGVLADVVDVMALIDQMAHTRLPVLDTHFLQLQHRWETLHLEFRSTLELLMLQIGRATADICCHSQVNILLHVVLLLLMLDITLEALEIIFKLLHYPSEMVAILALLLIEYIAEKRFDSSHTVLTPLPRKEVLRR